MKADRPLFALKFGRVLSPLDSLISGEHYTFCPF